MSLLEYLQAGFVRVDAEATVRVPHPHEENICIVFVLEKLTGLSCD